MRRRKTRRRSGRRILVILLLLILGALILRDNFLVRSVEYELRFPDLPTAFDGLRILHISDLHGGIS